MSEAQNNESQLPPERPIADVVGEQIFQNLQHTPAGGDSLLTEILATRRNPIADHNDPTHTAIGVEFEMQARQNPRTEELLPGVFVIPKITLSGGADTLIQPASIKRVDPDTAWAGVTDEQKNILATQYAILLRERFEAELTDWSPDSNMVRAMGYTEDKIAEGRAPLEAIIAQTTRLLASLEDGRAIITIVPAICALRAVLPESEAQ